MSLTKVGDAELDKSVALFYSRLGVANDAIAEYTRQLAFALERRGYDVRQITRTMEVSALAGGAGQILWQYNPFSYGARGFALNVTPVPAWFRFVRSTPVCVTFHEMYFPLRPLSMRAALWGVVQRMQFAIVGASATALIATTGVRTRTLRRCFPWLSDMTKRIPVGSNVPVVAQNESQRAHTRAALGVSTDTLLVGSLGVLGGGLMVSSMIEMLATLRRQHVNAKLALLGRLGGRRSVALVEEAAENHGQLDHLILPGATSAERLSRQLTALDVFVAAYDDGISGRRTGVAAALAHGLPIVATRGHNTDDDWFGDGAAATVVSSPTGACLARALGPLTADSARARLSAGARKLYHREFSWECIANEYSEFIELTGSTHRDRGRG